jgi:cytochrome c
MLLLATWLLAAGVCLLPMSQVVAGAGQGDAEKGRMLFETRCTGCHTLDNNREGPRLRGVYGRQAGSVPDFHYSDALKSAHIVWDDRLLDQWLADPEAIVPDNDMGFHVPSAEQRANVIQFLRVVSGK